MSSNRTAAPGQRSRSAAGRVHFVVVLRGPAAGLGAGGCCRCALASRRRDGRASGSRRRRSDQCWSNFVRAGLQTGSPAGLSAPVTVRRDAHGVPHIEAATQGDLFVAQGYVTAQDRLWQMDTLRRNAGNGELAFEGPWKITAPTTRWQRRSRTRVTAQRIYDNLDPADRARLIVATITHAAAESVHRTAPGFAAG